MPLSMAIAAVACGGVQSGPSDLDAGRRVPKDHRPEGVACLSTRGAFMDMQPPNNACLPSFAFPGNCTRDADCTAGTNGRCTPRLGPAGCGCSYDTCTSDGDCSAATSCICRATPDSYEANFCVSSNCRVDADCGSNGYCSPSCGGSGGIYCRTAADTCVDDSECPLDTTCNFDSERRSWTCSSCPVPG